MGQDSDCSERQSATAKRTRLVVDLLQSFQEFVVSRHGLFSASGVLCPHLVMSEKTLQNLQTREYTVIGLPDSFWK